MRLTRCLHICKFIDTIRVIVADVILRAQGAAQAFEDAAVLGSLFSHVKDREQIPGLLTKFQQIRMSRSMKVLRRSAAMREVFGMPDGIAQHERDAQIAMDPHEGCPIALADPVFQKWLWGYNAVEDANGYKGKGKE